MEDRNPARRIEVVFAEVDRKVAVELEDGHPDTAAQELVDGLVSALGIADADEAEQELASGAGRHVRVHRVS